MKRHLFSKWESLGVMLLLALTLFGAQQSGTASIQGRIVRAGTTQGVWGVRVTGENTSTQTQTTATTGVTGAFVLTDLGPGTYRLTFVARGYVDHVYGRRGNTGPWTPVELAAGQAIKDLVTTLTPTGSLEGRVRDGGGSPAFGAPIALLQAVYDSDGKKTFSPVATATTDDRGEFRIFWISPGRYYLRAGGRMPMSLQMIGRVVGSQTADPFGEVFFSGAQNPESATPIDIQPGADLQGMDFRLQSQRLLRIRGRVIDTQTGRIPPDADIGLIGDTFSSSGGDRYNKTDGTFEIGELFPGTFKVVAALRDLAPSSSRTATGDRLPVPTSELALVQLIDKDVDDVVLRLLPPVGMKGRVIFEGGTRPTSDLRIRLQSVNGLVTPSSDTFMGLVTANGSFEIPQVVEGVYRVAVSDAGFYVKQARYGGSDVVNEPLKFSGSASTALEITLSSNLARVSGTITDRLLQPVSGVNIVLAPERGRHRRDLFKEATTGAGGRYSLTNVPPGDYRVYAWEFIEARSWFDSDILKKFEQHSRLVRLQESSSETADMMWIPRETP